MVHEEPEDLNCTLAEDLIPNGFYEVTHVLTNPLAHLIWQSPSTISPSLVNMFKTHVEVAFVNFLSVDFYSIGDGLQVVDAINQEEDLIWNIPKKTLCKDILSYFRFYNILIVCKRNVFL